MSLSRKNVDKRGIVLFGCRGQDGVEQQLERSVGLRAMLDFDRDQDHSALAQPDFRQAHLVVKMGFSMEPTALEDVPGWVPDDNRAFHGRKRGDRLEDQ